MTNIEQILTPQVESNLDYLQDRFGSAYPFWVKANEYLAAKYECVKQSIQDRLKLDEVTADLEEIECSLEKEIIADTRLTNEQARRTGLKSLKQNSRDWLVLTRETIPNLKASIAQNELKAASYTKLYNLAILALSPSTN